MEVKEDSRVRLSDDKSTFGSNHDALGVSRVLDCFQEAPWDTGCALNTWAVVEVAVVVGRAILNPVTYEEVNNNISWACKEQGSPF